MRRLLCFLGFHSWHKWNLPDEPVWATLAAQNYLGTSEVEAGESTRLVRCQFCTKFRRVK